MVSNEQILIENFEEYYSLAASALADSHYNLSREAAEVLKEDAERLKKLSEI